MSERTECLSVGLAGTIFLQWSFFMRTLIPALMLAFASCSQALTIEIRYELTGSQFYNQPGAKEALRTAADFYQKLITDQLGAINPAQYKGATWTPTYAHPNTGAEVAMTAQANLVVPADTIIIYAGSMNLGIPAARAGSGAAKLGSGGGLTWWNQVYNRGEPGAIRILSSGWGPSPTDFAPWGGVIFFNSAITNWNFSTSSAAGTAGPDALSVALHEIGHILGLGIYRSDCSWLTLIEGNLFTGPLASQSFGTSPPTDGTHVLPGSTKSPAYGCFGIPHGTPVLPLMSASLPASHTFNVPTDLDVAMLRDIGWELTLPERPLLIAAGATPNAVNLSVPTSTGFDYGIHRSTDLVSWGGPLVTLQGNGSVLKWTDSGVPPKAFYQVNRSTAAASGAVTAMETETEAGSGAILTPPVGPKPVICDCIGHH
jgi:hypothetical protein